MLNLNPDLSFQRWLDPDLTGTSQIDPEQMSSSSAPKKRGLGRGPNQIPKAPVNPDERILIQMRPHPDSTDFADSKIVKCISQLCLQNWPTPVITWASTPLAHKDAVWAEFQINHPGQSEECMHEYSPWWCAPTIWAGMCEQWKAESWVKRRRTAAVNRASGAPEGNKAPGTYKGGSISQLQHVAAMSLDPDELADAVAAAAQQETDDVACLDDNA
ncbi:hypothetical protein MRB53_001968 [Persea americana]|uniref:Uncharacterized protein n=1 Tax=Persea americana TaxID=3435 RepID=A0ACC2MTG5_PERAE|nr:hypothetical protein MRB53_001968 [Persea americana]